MEIIDGNRLADEILHDTASATRMLTNRPRLHVLMVGGYPASEVYVEKKRQAAEKVGIEFTLHQYPTETHSRVLEECIDALNQDDSVTGYFFQLPMPESLDADHLLNKINPLKDVDCLTAENLGLLAQRKPRFLPATAAAINHVLDRYQLKLSGKRVAVIGRGRIAGLPIALEMLNRDATVTIAHQSTGDLTRITKQSDVIISAVGKPGLVKGSMVSPGATLIDVGWARQNGTPAGDIDPTDLPDDIKLYTPVPGGIGPLTVASLLRNVVQAATEET